MDANYDDVTLQTKSKIENLKINLESFYKKNTRIEEPTKKKNKRKKRE